METPTPESRRHLWALHSVYVAAVEKVKPWVAQLTDEETSRHFRKCADSIDLYRQRRVKLVSVRCIDDTSGRLDFEEALKPFYFVKPLSELDFFSCFVLTFQVRSIVSPYEDEKKETKVLIDRQLGSVHFVCSCHNGQTSLALWLKAMRTQAPLPEATGPGPQRTSMTCPASG